MSQTSGDSERVVVLADILGHNPEIKNSKYEILKGGDTPGSLEIGVGPGMTIPVKDGININPESELGEKILENQRNRKRARNEKQR